MRITDLPGGENASTFHGHRHGAPVSAFVSRTEPHRQISIHPVARMETEWLE